MWKTEKLGDVCEFRQGIQVGKNLQKEQPEKKSDVRFLRIIDFTQVNELPRYIDFPGEKYLVDKNDVSLVRYGNPGFVCRGLEGVIANNLFRVIPKTSEIHNDFLYWFLMSPFFQEKIGAGKKGVAMQAISFGAIKDIDVPLPPLAEQQRIVAKLDAAFAEIDMARELSYARRIKADSLKSALLSESLNDNTTMWRKVKLGDVVLYDKTNAQGSNLPYVGMENISSESMKLVGNICVPENTSSTFQFDDNHVLFGRLRPYLRKVLIPNFTGQCSTEVFCIKPSHDLLRGYLAYWLLQPSISKKIDATSTGARMPRANMNKLLEFTIQLPTITEQQRIVSKLDTAFSSMETFASVTATIEENYNLLKSSILVQELNPSEAA